MPVPESTLAPAVVTSGQQSDTEPSEREAFNPSAHFINLRGDLYLPSRMRVLWLRDEHPDAHIETELIRDDGTMVVFKARVSIPGGGSATGWGTEKYADFGDALEKAETRALGRALGALGYGTESALDMDEAGHVADSPINAQAGGAIANRPRGGRGTLDLATEKQVKAMYAIANANGHDIAAVCMEKYGVTPEQLERRDASAFIDLLKQPAAKPAPKPPAPQRPAQPPPPPPAPLPTGGRLGEKALGQWLARARAQFPAPGAVEQIARDLTGATPEQMTIVQAREVMEAIEGGLLALDGSGRYVLAGPVWDDEPAEDGGDRRANGE